MMHSNVNAKRVPLRGLEAHFQWEKPRSKETAVIRTLSEPANDGNVFLGSRYVILVELTFARGNKKGPAYLQALLIWRARQDSNPRPPGS